MFREARARVLKHKIDRVYPTTASTLPWTSKQTGHYHSTDNRLKNYAKTKSKIHREKEDEKWAIGKAS